MHRHSMPEISIVSQETICLSQPAEFSFGFFQFSSHHVLCSQIPVTCWSSAQLSSLIPYSPIFTSGIYGMLLKLHRLGLYDYLWKPTLERGARPYRHRYYTTGNSVFGSDRSEGNIYRKPGACPHVSLFYFK